MKRSPFSHGIRITPTHVKKSAAFICVNTPPFVNSWNAGKLVFLPAQPWRSISPWLNLWKENQNSFQPVDKKRIVRYTIYK